MRQELTKPDGSPLGARSRVYKDNDPILGNIIIKTPITEGDLYYIEKQANGYNVIKELLESGQDIGVNLPQLISIHREKYEIIEKELLGNDLDSDIYNSLTESQKNNLAKQMAKFLNSMHSLHAPQDTSNTIKSIWRGNRGFNSAHDMIDVYENKLSEQTIRMIINAEKYLMSVSVADEMSVITHRDIRSQNVLYNENTQQLSVIDFEDASIDNIYNDFIPNAPSSITSWDFTQRILKFYNGISNKKYKLTIDIEKVRNALIYGTASEMAYCFQDKKEKNTILSDFDYAKVLDNRLQTFINNNITFQNAIKNINTKMTVQKHIRNRFQND